MRNRFDRQLVQLNDELIEMGGMIENLPEKGGYLFCIQKYLVAKVQVKVV